LIKPEEYEKRRCLKMAERARGISAFQYTVWREQILLTGKKILHNTENRISDTNK